MNKVREFLRGKKAYMTAAIGLAGAVIAWADGQIDTVALLAAVWAAAQAVCERRLKSAAGGGRSGTGRSKSAAPFGLSELQTGQ